MKRTLLLILSIFSVSFSIAQPQMMTYQAVVRNSNNELVINQQIGIQISILEDNANGPIAYAERHTAQTNANALFSINIGSGTPLLINNMADIKWGKHNHFMRVQIDPTGGTNYTITGTQQLLSVPYSLYSDKSKYVDTALYAKNATTANYSTYSDSTLYSYSAIYSTYTDSSWFSIYAINAIHVDTAHYTYNAAHSDTANYSAIANAANSAFNATYSDTSLFATNSNHSIYADTALYLINAQTSDTAKFAYHSDTANYSTIANSANNAFNATYSDTSLFATNSNHSIYADTALYLINAQTSDTAKYAYHSDTANYAHNANSATIANTATNALTANHADTSLYTANSHHAILADTATIADYNKLLNKPAGTNRGDILYWETTDSSWHIVPAGNAGEILIMDTNKIPYWHSNIISLPNVITDSVINVTKTTATVISTITGDGGAALVFGGICWDTISHPTILNNHTLNGIGINSFTSNLQELIQGMTYYVRAYASNNAGIVYGNEISFTTTDACAGVTTVKDYDDNTYHTLALGKQCWMKENMRTTHYAQGADIPLGNGTSSTTAYRYYPNGNSSNVSTYGYLYNWPAAMHGASSSGSNPSGVQGICPNGWHVPSDAEWIQLENYLGTQNHYICGGTNTSVAKSLASTTGWNYHSNTCAVGNDQTDNNSTGFNALPGGYYNGPYVEFGNCAYFWSTTELSNTNVFSRYLSYGAASIIKGYYDPKLLAIPVRCLKD